MNILFVCTGNTCRSPLAEGLARRIAQRRGLTDVTISSAGISAWENCPASDGSVLVGMERQVDLTNHRARVLTPEIVSHADLIFVMTPSHLDPVKQMGGRGKVHVLDAYASGTAGEGISDPYGGDLSAYREAADALELHLEKVFDRLKT
jgi:protein-tyrosine-phosphatase